ncbi:hypothetical protein [Microbulbifer sp.]|uniref:hypothetical protein n=1 Tax=Microbulbifer sp. TaxID=1908541 RepID=UPI003F32D9D8
MFVHVLGAAAGGGAGGGFPQWNCNCPQCLGERRAADMGHLPQSGEGGMIEVLRPLQKTHKVLIHINNTNPILDEGSRERAILEREGIEVAWDGMEIEL